MTEFRAFPVRYPNLLNRSSWIFEGGNMIDIRSATRISIFIILSLGLGGLSAFAQFSSGIEGIAHDQSGAVIAGATVTVTDIRLGVAKGTTTNDAGYFRIDSIAAATYSVEIKQSSFKT